MIVSFFQYFLPFTLLLGTLVFFHELGHFLVARYFGVRVEVFSLGFGPKIFKFKKGDTLYCVSLIPLGGYVKMFGDNPKKMVTGPDRQVAFLTQKVGPKIAIALAGPLMNLFLAVVLFMALSFIGRQKALPQLGDIQEKSQAYSAGFRSNDKIISINNQATPYWEDVQKWIKNNPEKKITVQIERADSLQQIEVIPQRIRNTHLTTLAQFIGKVEGLTIGSTSSHIGVSNSNSLAYQHGLRTFDEIKELNGSKISNWRDLKETISNNPSSPIQIKIQRENQSQWMNIEIPISSPINLKQLGIESTELYIDRVKENSPADQTGLKTKDRLLKWNGKPLKQWEDFASAIQNYKEHPKPFEISILREGVEKQLSIHTEKMPIVHPDGSIENRYMIGVASAQYIALPELTTVRMTNPFSALNYGIRETARWVAVTGKVLWKLVTGSISHRIIGGPLSIAKVAKKSFSESAVEFLAMMAIVSVNLFLMNLLPIPVLDGGHLLLFSIEGIKGSALSPRKVEIVQMCGLAVILFFIILTFMNDIGNWNLIW